MKPNLKIKAFVLIYTLFLSSYLFSQEPWSLEQCIIYALENNIQIKQQKLNTEYNANLLEQSKADIYPNLSASGSYGASFGRALDQTTYEFTQNQTVQSVNFGVNTSVTLFNGFQKLNTIKKNNFDLRASLFDLEKLKNDISLNIAAAYLQILFNKELLEVARNQSELTSQQVGRTKALVDAGSVALGNLLEIQAQQAADEVQVVNYENLLSLSYLNLAQILDLDSVAKFSIVIPEIKNIDEKSLVTGINDIYNVAELKMPQIKASEFRLESAKKGFYIAKASRLPRVSLSGNYGSGYSDIRQQVVDIRNVLQTVGYTPDNQPVTISYPSPVYGNYPISDQFKDNASASIFVNLSMPLFTNLQIKKAINNSKINMENSALELANIQNILFKDIQEAFADAFGALKKYKATEKALLATQESFNYTKEKYEVGLVNTLDFNLAKTQLGKIQSDLLQAKYDFIFKTQILNFYRGKPIKLQSE